MFQYYPETLPIRHDRKTGQARGPLRRPGLAQDSRVDLALFHMASEINL